MWLIRRYIMVRFGAKEAALIVDRNEWWRVATPIFIHAGIFHIIPNVAVQVCNYTSLMMDVWIRTLFMLSLFYRTV